MVEKSNPLSKTPIIFIAPTSKSAYSIFNSNDWTGESQAIIRSCATQLSLLRYTIVRMRTLPQVIEGLYLARVRDLKEQWRAGPWDIEMAHHLVEVPEAYLYIQTFLVTTKGLLDLLAQLITTEKIVSSRIDAFRGKKKEVGGGLLHILETKAHETKKETATQLLKLIRQHKTDWIDLAVQTRHNLAHPVLGMSLVMFEIELTLDDNEIKPVRIIPPTINNQTFSQYAEATISHIETFSRDFLQLLKGGIPE